MTHPEPPITDGMDRCERCGRLVQVSEMFFHACQPRSEATCHDKRTPVCGKAADALRQRLADTTCRRAPPSCTCPRHPPCDTVPRDGCMAQTWESLVDCWTRCILPAGHDGHHSDGCMMWMDRELFWRTAEATR